MRLVLGLTLLISSHACAFGRKPPEPVITWCSAYGDGSWECRKKDGTFETRMPSEMEQYLAAPIDDLEIYRQYCRKRKN